MLDVLRQTEKKQTVPAAERPATAARVPSSTRADLREEVKEEIPSLRSVRAARRCKPRPRSLPRPAALQPAQRSTDTASGAALPACTAAALNTPVSAEFRAVHEKPAWPHVPSALPRNSWPITSRASVSLQFRELTRATPEKHSRPRASFASFSRRSREASGPPRAAQPGEEGARGKEGPFVSP